MKIIDHLLLFPERSLTEEDIKRFEKMLDSMKSLRKSSEANIVFSVKSVDGEDTGKACAGEE